MRFAHALLGVSVSASVALSCGGAKSPSSEPLTPTRLELTLDDGTKPQPLTGRAFAFVQPAKGSSPEQLIIYVFDADAPEISCTDVTLGDWMDRLGHGHLGMVYVTGFPRKPGKFPVTSVGHVRSSGSRKFDMRSGPAKDAEIEVIRWDELFEGAISGGGRSAGASGKVSGIVCAVK